MLILSEFLHDITIAQKQAQRFKTDVISFLEDLILMFLG